MYLKILSLILLSVLLTACGNAEPRVNNKKMSAEKMKEIREKAAASESRDLGGPEEQ